MAEKKIVRNFLKNLKFFIFFEFFSENVFESLLRGREVTRKKYRVKFEKYTFFDKKFEKIAEKKIVRNFLTDLKFFIFFEFFSENVSKTLLRGRETTGKKY